MYFICFGFISNGLDAIVAYYAGPEHCKTLAASHGRSSEHVREQFLSMTQYLQVQAELECYPAGHDTSLMIAICRNSCSNIDPRYRNHSVVAVGVHYSILAVAVAGVHCIDLEPAEVVR